MLFSMPKQRAILLGLLGVAVVFALDAAVGFEVNLLVLHIIPVLFVTWFATVRWGVFFAALITFISAIIAAYIAPPLPHPSYRYLDVGSDFLAMLLLVYMQWEVRKSYVQIMRQSRTDALTGCLNKVGFYEQLQAEIDRHERYRRPFSLVYFDCDNFKTVNDTLGHHVGDLLLAEIGRVVRDKLRAVDSVGRLGGDEFAALLIETEAAAAQRAAEHIKQALDAEMTARDWPVGFSIGIASFETPPANASDALQMADTLMYEVKKHGKNGMRMQRF